MKSYAAASCPEIYEAVSKNYVKKVSRLSNEAFSAGVVSKVGAGGVVMCVLTAPAAIPCALAVGGIALIAYWHQRGTLSELDRLEQIHKVNLVYKKIKSGAVKEREVQEFVQMLGVDGLRAEEALGKVAWLMESGSLCRRGKPTARLSSLPDHLNAVTARTLF
ncbi:MAG: hypothetical protein KF799_03610 [Bdellovibrionales bacterium]|nr:hypothetical protein [Bdellovibrionales bacterium]